jgi:hypothetical protein
MSSIMSRLSYMPRILFWSIAKHVRICQVLCLDWLTCLEFYFEVLLNMSTILFGSIASDACCCFFNIKPGMVSKYSELVKRHARDRYGRFTHYYE